jgi:hypothetical protein
VRRLVAAPRIPLLPAILLGLLALLELGIRTTMSDSVQAVASAVGDPRREVPNADAVDVARASMIGV